MNEVFMSSRRMPGPITADDAFLERLMRSSRSYFVYILASGHNGTLYIGVTRDIHRRMAEHRAGRGAEFVRKYSVLRLVYVEEYGAIMDAIAREKQLKNWKRDWKIALIERDNGDWCDLSRLL